jgi:GNAT superfamily N-acetyltransferase
VQELRPLSFDRARAIALAREAFAALGSPEEELRSFHSRLEREVSSGTALGRLWTDGDRGVGLAVWQAESTLGIEVTLLYLDEAHRGPRAYEEFLGGLRASAGPVAFAPGNLAGLSPAEESELMERLGFARFARSEMRFPADAPVPTDPLPGRSRELRAATAADVPGLARLHERAYENHFDRYLFLADPDPVRDAELAVQEIVGGRWGEFLPWASPVLGEDGALTAATLVVRAPYGPLLADVMVDPRVQGRGLGRAALTWTVRALRERGESVIVLNVTEGNVRARRLYERFGFVRSLGPSHGWYSTERIPVPPALD